MVEAPLHGLRVAVTGSGTATRHAAALLASLGATIVTEGEADGVLRGDDRSALEDWAASGAMALTGRADGPALASPGAPASCVRGALLALEFLAELAELPVRLPGSTVLSERAALAGLARRAPVSAGGSFRLLRASDGWFGMNLARESDVELLPALFGHPVADGWPAVAAAMREGTTTELAERARLLGLATSAVGGGQEQLRARGQRGRIWPFVLDGVVRRPGPAVADRPRHWRWRSPLVVDLSSLWAGPLCGHLLTGLGARVVKVESATRPDGARSGSAAFFDLLHAGQESVVLDFDSAAGRDALLRLVEAADVVIEASRPRALRQLGLDAGAIVASGAPTTWISITAYGRTGPWSNAAGFGDDVASAAGLVAFDPATGTPAPCGDAIADPLTGVNAALVAVACWLDGGRWLADLAMHEQVAATLAYSEDRRAPVEPAPPIARVAPAPAPAPGADTDRWLAELGRDRPASSAPAR